MFALGWREGEAHLSEGEEEEWSVKRDSLTLQNWSLIFSVFLWLLLGRAVPTHDGFSHRAGSFFSALFSRSNLLVWKPLDFQLKLINDSRVRNELEERTKYCY